MTDLKLDLYGSYDAGDKRHAQAIMTGLGIKRTYDVPQSIADQWWFLGCENVPDDLPPFISRMEIDDYHRLIGMGLDKEMADALTDKRMVSAMAESMAK